MLLVPLALALAEPMECAVTEVWATTPAPLATNVPIDAVPAGLVRDGSCGGSITATLSIPSTGDTVKVVEQLVDAELIVEVDPGVDLLPDTTYSLSFAAADGGATEIGFTTGSGRVVGLEGAPAVASAIVRIDQGGTTQVQAEVEVAASAEGESIVVLALEGQDGSIDVTLSDAGTVQLVGFTWLDGAPDEVCVVAHQRDLAGNWTTSAPNCVAPDLEAPSKGGCFANNREEPPVTRGVAALGLLFLGFARRRRR